MRIQDHLRSQSGPVKGGLWGEFCETLLAVSSSPLCGSTDKHLAAGLGRCWSSEPVAGKKCRIESGGE